MDSLTELIQKQIKHPVLLACSAGVDSMVLAQVLYDSGLLAAVLHCQFGLRKEAYLDEILLQKWTSERKIPLFVNHFQTEKYAEEHKISIQMAARELRYQWFKSCHEILKLHIALAHHLDDHAETIFYNLFRNKDFHILQGIPLQRDFLIRPLLQVSKKTIIQYAEKHQIPWAEDHSNQETNYARNKIRHLIFKPLTEIQQNPAQCLAERTNVYQMQIKVLDGFLENEKKKWLLHQENRFFIDIGFIENLKTFEKEIYIRWFADKYVQLTEKETIEWLTHFLAKTGSKLAIQSKEVIQDRQFWVIQDPLEKPEEKILEIGIQFWGDYQIEMSLEKLENEHIRIPKQLIQGDLKIRVWNLQDRYQPKGLKGTQKISDVLTNMKFPSWLKSNAFVLVDDCQVYLTENFRPSALVFKDILEESCYFISFKRLKNFYPVSN